MSQNKNRFTILPDEELMLLLREGEVQAFDELHLRYARRLFAYFFRMLNFQKQAAEDAVQDVFLKIAEAPERFDASRAFRTWVFSVACNYCKNYYRHRQVMYDSRDELLQENAQVNEKAFIDLALGMDGKRFREMLYRVLEELPPAKKEAFLLKYQEDRTLAEIAQIQDCPEGSVKSRLHYTLKVLEEKLRMFNPVT